MSILMVFPLITEISTIWALYTFLTVVPSVILRLAPLFSIVIAICFFIYLRPLRCLLLLAHLPRLQQSHQSSCKALHLYYGLCHSSRKPVILSVCRLKPVFFLS